MLSWRDWYCDITQCVAPVPELPWPDWLCNSNKAPMSWLTGKWLWSKPGPELRWGNLQRTILTSWQAAVTVWILCPPLPWYELSLNCTSCKKCNSFRVLLLRSSKTGLILWSDKLPWLCQFYIWLLTKMCQVLNLLLVLRLGTTLNDSVKIIETVIQHEWSLWR